MISTTEYIKTNTQHLHQELEDRLGSHRIFTDRFSTDDYQELIRVNYSFISAFEKAVFDAFPPQLQQELQLSERRKLPLIQQDSEYIGIQPETDQNSLPKFNILKAFGYLYIMEGSTLGGNVIARQLKKYADFAGYPFHFFGLYGERTGAMWQNFKEIINREISSEEDQKECLLSAKEAYAHYLQFSGALRSV